MAATKQDQVDSSVPENPTESMEEDADAASSSAKIEVKFVTKLEERYKVPETPFSLPGRLTPHGLSEAINHLLGNNAADEGSVPAFQFIVADEFLSGSLEQHLIDRAIPTGEGTITVEYTLAMPAPKQDPPLPHDDWVSCVASCGKYFCFLETIVC